MNRYKILLRVGLELEAFTSEDAKELAAEAIMDIEGLGIMVSEVEIQSAREIG